MIGLCGVWVAGGFMTEGLGLHIGVWDLDDFPARNSGVGFALLGWVSVVVVTFLFFGYPLTVLFRFHVFV